MPTLLSMIGNAAFGTAVGAGQQAISNALNRSSGMAMARFNDNRQARLNQELLRQQINANQQMGDYNFAKQLEMWERTNYGAQMEQIKKAGLNPGLMYGMGGGGGATNSFSGANVGSGGAGAAPAGNGQFMGLDLLAMKANIELMEANAEKARAEAKKTAGVDTDLTNTQIADLKQGIQNKKAVEVLTWAESEIMQVKASIERQTKMDQMKTIENLAKEGDERIRALQLANDLSKEQFNDKIKQFREQTSLIMAETAVKNVMKENVSEDTKLKAQQIAESQQRVKALVNNIMLGWYNAEQRDREIMINDNEKDDFDIIKDFLPNFIIGSFGKKGK